MATQTLPHVVSIPQSVSAIEISRQELKKVGAQEPMVGPASMPVTTLSVTCTFTVLGNNQFHSMWFHSARDIPIRSGCRKGRLNLDLISGSKKMGCHHYSG